MVTVNRSVTGRPRNSEPLYNGTPGCASNRNKMALERIQLGVRIDPTMDTSGGDPKGCVVVVGGYAGERAPSPSELKLME